jgi:hypothetical protein
MAEFSAPMNRSTSTSTACFTINSSKFQMPLNSKVVSPNILHTFLFGWFWSVEGNFWGTRQVLEWHRRLRE